MKIYSVINLGHILFTDLFDFILDGEHIAVASHDGSIYVHAVYDEGTTYRRVGCCSVSFLLCHGR